MKLRFYISPDAIQKEPLIDNLSEDERILQELRKRSLMTDDPITTLNPRKATVAVLSESEPVFEVLALAHISHTGGLLLGRRWKDGISWVDVLEPDPLIYQRCCPCGADFSATKLVPVQCDNRIHPDLRCRAYQMIVPRDASELLRGLNTLVQIARSESDSEDEKISPLDVMAPEEFGWQIAPYPGNNNLCIMSLWKERPIGAQMFRHCVGLTFTGAGLIVARLGVPRHKNGRRFPVQTSVLYAALARREWRGLLPRPEARDGWYIENLKDESADLPIME